MYCPYCSHRAVCNIFLVADTRLYTLPCRSVSRSVSPSVRHIFEFRAVFAPPLPNRPRLDCRVSGLISFFLHFPLTAFSPTPSSPSSSIFFPSLPSPFFFLPSKSFSSSSLCCSFVPKESIYVICFCGRGAWRKGCVPPVVVSCLSFVTFP